VLLNIGRHASTIGDSESVVVDSRLLRLGLISSSATAVSADGDVAPRRRRVFEATVVEESDSDKDSDVPRRATIDDGEQLHCSVFIFGSRSFFLFIYL
jgi:hypothetical protein